jgi:hypothetical protein
MKYIFFNPISLLQNLLIRYVCRFFAAFMFITIAPTTGFSQTKATAKITLPAEAQEAINKGIMAAKLPDYLLSGIFRMPAKLPRTHLKYFSTWDWLNRKSRDGNCGPFAGSARTLPPIPMRQTQPQCEILWPDLKSKARAIFRAY